MHMLTFTAQGGRPANSPMKLFNERLGQLAYQSKGLYWTNSMPQVSLKK